MKPEFADEMQDLGVAQVAEAHARFARAVVAKRPAGSESASAHGPGLAVEQRGHPRTHQSNFGFAAARVFHMEKNSALAQGRPKRDARDLDFVEDVLS